MSDQIVEIPVASLSESAVSANNVVTETVVPQGETQSAVEPAPVVEEAPVEETPKAEPVAAKLAKQRQKEVQLSEREKALAEREAKLVSQEQFVSKLKSKPIQALKEAGLSMKELAELIVADDGDGIPEDPIKKVTQTVEELKAELERERQAAREAQQKAQDARNDAIINDFKQKAISHVKENKDKYELIAASNSEEAVYDLIEEYWSRTKEVLTFDKAAGMVEEYLEKRADAIASTNKYKAKFSNKAQTGEKPNTLTNGLQSFSAPAQAIAANLSREERIALAAKRLQFRD